LDKRFGPNARGQHNRITRVLPLLGTDYRSLGVCGIDRGDLLFQQAAAISHEVWCETLHQSDGILAMTVRVDEVRLHEVMGNVGLKLSDLIGVQNVDPHSGRALKIDGQAVLLVGGLRAIDEELSGAMEEMLEASVLEKRRIGV